MAVAGPDGAVDVLIVSVGATTGWRAAARELGAAFEGAGARTVTVDTGPVREVRTFMLTDLVQAVAARRAAERGIARYRPRVVVYCSLTAALLWPAPGVIWTDAMAAENRPGRHGVWQRPLERRRLAESPLVLTMAADALAPLGVAQRPESVVVPVAVQSSGRAGAVTVRDIDVVAYAADPVKRRLDFVLETWRRARPTSRACASPAGCPRTSSVRCCAARACSWRRRGARTSASPNSRRWPTAPCW